MGSHRSVQHGVGRLRARALTVAVWAASLGPSASAGSPASAAVVDRRRRLAVRDDRGSAPVDFVLIGALTTVLFVAVLQLALALHVRATLVDCAAEGARYGALADRTPADGAARTRQLIGMSLGPRYADDVVARIEVHDGLEVVEVQVRAPLPVMGLLGPGTALTVDGHALREAAHDR